MVHLDHFFLIRMRVCLTFLLALALIQSGDSFRYPSTVLNHWKPRWPRYVAPAPEPEPEEIEEDLVMDPEEMKDIKQDVLQSLQRLGRNNLYYGKKTSEELLEALVDQHANRAVNPLFRLN